MVDHLKDLYFKPDASVAVLSTRQPIYSNIDLAWMVDNDEGDVCLITHGLKIASDAAPKHKAAAKVIDLRLGYLTLRLH